MSFYDDASLIMYPSGYKEDKIYSLKPTDGSGDLTFTRASTATRVNAEGLIEEMPYNKITYSNDFSNAAWIKTNSTITANTTTSPDGTQNASTLVISSSGYLLRQYTASVSAGGSWALSIFAKNQITNFLRFGGATPSGTDTYSIQDVGNGWYRHSLVRTFASAYASFNLQLIINEVGTHYIYGGQIEQGSTAKTYFPTTDRLNVPRIDYTGGGCGKLLLEPQRTNLNTYSEDIPQNYLATEISDTFGYSTSPNGLQTSTRLQLSNLGSSRYVHTLTGIVSSGTSYNFSCYYKGTQGETAYMYALPVGGTAITKAITFTGEWQRENLTFTAGSASNYVYIVDSRQGGDASDFEVWGVQVEAGSYATSIINTAGATVTRTQDSSSTTGLSSVINSTEGTMFVEMSAFVGANEDRQISISDGGTSNRVVMALLSNGTQIQFVVASGGSITVNTTQTIATITSGTKIAFAYKANDFKIYANGLLIASDTSGAVPTGMDTLGFDRGDGNDKFYGNVQNLMVFPSALTDDELATLTTL